MIYIKNYEKELIYVFLLAMSILFLVCSLQTTFAANQSINDTSIGGISAAVASANANDVVTLAPGTYNKTNQDVNIAINKNITIQGNGSTDSVKIDARGLSRIFSIVNNLNVTFINVTFINGFVSNNGSAIYNPYAGTMITIMNCTFTNNDGFLYGGAIWNAGHNLTVINSTFNNNGRSQYSSSTHIAGGGAIYNTGNNFKISNSSFNNNNASSGGAIYNGGNDFYLENCHFNNNTASVNGAILNRGNNFTVINSTFRDNVVGIYGAAIWNIGANSTVINSSFINNTAATGGAIFNSGSSNDGSSISDNFKIINSTFIGNNAGSGGAIYSGGLNVSIMNCTFNDNKATNGGAIDNSGGYPIACNITVINSTFNNNIASNDGGAIRDGAYANQSNSSLIVNCTFNNNVANNRGGAIYGGSPASNWRTLANVFNSTFVNNSAAYGGGIFNGGIRNTDIMIVSGNTMNGNTATVLGNVIYNNATMSVLNLTYLDNSTKIVGINTPVTLYATLTDDMFNPVTGRNITFYVNGTLIGIVDSVEGHANISFTPNVLGIVPVYGTYSGNGVYPINIKRGQLDVVFKLDTNSTIVVPNNSKANKTVNITGVATDEFGNSLVNITLNVTVDGVTYTVTTDNGGNWVLAYTPTHAGSIGVLVQWAGNDVYFGFINATSFNVEKIVTNSTIVVPKHVKVGKTINITGVVSDEFDNPVGNVAFNVIVDGVMHTVTTDSGGNWVLAYTPTHAGSIGVLVQWLGNDVYFGFINATSFNVEKIVTNSTIVVPKHVKVGKTINITGVVTDEFGNPVANKLINVTVDNKTFTVITDSNGKWTLPFTPTHVGNITVIVSWEGNDIYFGFTNTTSFVVEQNGNKTPEEPEIIEKVVMKNTGVPILAIFLVLISSFCLGIGRKQK